MGYTGIRTTETFEQVFLQEYSDFTVIEYHKHGNQNRAEIYAAIHNPGFDVYTGLVVIFIRSGYGVEFKEISEYEHPYYYNCPLKIIQKLSDYKALREAGISQCAVYNAKQWREANLKNKRNVNKQTTYKYSEPVQSNLF